MTTPILYINNLDIALAQVMINVFGLELNYYKCKK